MNISETTPSSKESPQLVFLTGLPRSGTTWLQKLMGAHPTMGTAQESHLFNHFIGSQLRAWDHLLSFQDGRGGIGIPAYQCESEFLSMLNSQVIEVLSQSEEYHKGEIFVEKTPDHIRHILDIQRVIPDAKIIVMLRSPSDIIESMLSAGASWGKHWAPGSIFRAIRLYRYYSVKADSDMKGADQDKVLVVHYETLKSNTGGELKRILRFLGVEATDDIVSKMRNSKLELHRYGEFAKLNGSNLVEEPEGFARQKKGKLSSFQRLLVNTLIRQPEQLPTDSDAYDDSPSTA